MLPQILLLQMLPYFSEILKFSYIVRALNVPLCAHRLHVNDLIGQGQALPENLFRGQSAFFINRQRREIPASFLPDRLRISRPNCL